MKYLIDNQLPPALARHLRSSGLECDHVVDHGLDGDDDRTIWQFAGGNDFAIISKDEDFLDLSTADPAGPPFVWVRLGNCRTPALLSAFDRVLPQLIEALEAGQKVVEIR